MRKMDYGLISGITMPKIRGLWPRVCHVERVPLVLYEELRLSRGVGHLRSILLQLAGTILIVHAVSHRLVQQVGAQAVASL